MADEGTCGATGPSGRPPHGTERGLAAAGLQPLHRPALPGTRPRCRALWGCGGFLPTAHPPANVSRPRRACPSFCPWPPTPGLRGTALPPSGPHCPELCPLRLPPWQRSHASSPPLPTGCSGDRSAHTARLAPGSGLRAVTATRSLVPRTLSGRRNPQHPPAPKRLGTTVTGPETRPPHSRNAGSVPGHPVRERLSRQRVRAARTPAPVGRGAARTFTARHT